MNLLKALGFVFTILGTLIYYKLIFTAWLSAKDEVVGEKGSRLLESD